MSSAMADELQRARDRMLRSHERSTRLWIEASEKALALLPGASNSSHPAYSLWLRVECAKMPPMQLVASDPSKTDDQRPADPGTGEHP